MLYFIFSRSDCHKFFEEKEGYESKSKQGHMDDGTNKEVHQKVQKMEEV